MKKNSTRILPAALALLFAATGSSAFAQDIMGGGSEEDAMLQSLYNEDEDEDLARMLKSEDYIFPTTITDNWHVNFLLGVQNSWGSYDSELSFLKRTNFAAGISFGKFLTPVNDFRITLNYGRGTGVRGMDMAYLVPDARNEKDHDNPHYPYGLDEAYKLADNHTYHWHHAGVALQWMPNMTNLFCGYKPERNFTWSLLIGIGLEHTWGYTDDQLSMVSVWSERPKASVARTMIDLQYGAQLDWQINRHWHINLEVLNSVLDDTFDGLVSDKDYRLHSTLKGGEKNHLWDGHLNILGGVTYYLRSKNQIAHENANPFEDKYLMPVGQIQQNRDDIEDALANRGEVVNYVDVTKNVTYTLISFDEDRMEVPRLQQNNVFQTAETYKRNAGSKIFITNSNKVDDSLFHQRAWSISKILNQRWQIPLEDIWVDADENHIQQLQIPDCKSYIIFIINEE